MSEFLVINTEEKKDDVIEPFKLLREDHPFLKAVMNEYDVTTLPNPVMNKLIARLKMTMKLYNGLGLSANQCGIPERVFIIGTDQFQIVCINPKILSYSVEQKRMREGCLSFPGMYLSISRHEEIFTEYYNENGERKEVTLNGLTAQCFQHELDHMNGITFTSKVGPLALQLSKKRKDKLIKKVKKDVK